MKALVGAFTQLKPLVRALSVISNLRDFVVTFVWSHIVSRLVISARHTHSSSEKTNKYPLDQIQSLQLVDCRMQTHVRNSKLNIYNLKYEYNFNLEPLDFKASHSPNSRASHVPPSNIWQTQKNCGKFIYLYLYMICIQWIHGCQGLCIIISRRTIIKTWTRAGTRA